MMKSPRLQFKIFWCVMTILCAAFFVVAKSYISLLFALYCIYMAVVRDYIVTKKQYEMMKSHRQSDEWTRTVLIGDENIEMIEGEDSYKYDYSRITGIREKGDKIYLDLDDKMVIRMYQSAFVNTDWDTCKAYIKSKISQA